MHAGAGAYICGEETALLDSLEGRRGQPRLKPPFPATNGLYDAPTVVNNVGTLAERAVHRPGRRRLVQGARARGLARHVDLLAVRPHRRTRASTRRRWAPRCASCIELAGGMSRGKELKFWTPGGASCPLLTTEHLDLPLDFDAVVKAGSMNGTSAVQIFDEDDCVVRATKKWSEFFRHESCGKCTPCREGTYWYVGIYERLENGAGHRGGPRHAARPVRQHPRPLVLRAGRRRHQLGVVVDQVLPRRVPRARRQPRLPVRHARRPRPCRSPLIMSTPQNRSARSAPRFGGGPA